MASRARKLPVITDPCVAVWGRGVFRSDLKAHPHIASRAAKLTIERRLPPVRPREAPPPEEMPPLEEREEEEEEIEGSEDGSV